MLKLDFLLMFFWKLRLDFGQWLPIIIIVIIYMWNNEGVVGTWKGLINYKITLQEIWPTSKLLPPL